MLRSVLAILLGFVLIGALSIGTDAVIRSMYPAAFTPAGGTSDPAVLVGALIYVSIYAIAGCYLTARLAPSHPMRHAMILGVLGLLFSIAGTMSRWSLTPPWYNILGLVLVLPCAWIGGSLRERQLGSAPAGRTLPA